MGPLSRIQDQSVGIDHTEAKFLQCFFTFLKLVGSEITMIFSYIYRFFIKKRNSFSKFIISKSVRQGQVINVHS